MMVDTDALISTLDAHDDELDIDRLDLILLLAAHIDELGQSRNDFLLGYDICPMHQCDADICADDAVDECAELRAS